MGCQDSPERSKEIMRMPSMPFQIVHPNKYLLPDAFELARDASTRLMQEKVQKQLDAGISMDEINASIMGKTMMPVNPDDITPETAESALDFLILSAKSEKQRERLDYAKKALALDPESLDAALAVILLGTRDLISMKKKLETLMEKGKAQMEQQGLMDAKGQFWQQFETRPFIRVLRAHFTVLQLLGQYRNALAAGWEIISYNKGDNLGVRYDMMTMAAWLLDPDTALTLMARYQEEDAMMLLPLALLYFRLGKGKDSLRILHTLYTSNPSLFNVLDDLLDGGAMEEACRQDRLPLNAYHYTAFEDSEVFFAVHDNLFLYLVSGTFFQWALDNAKKIIRGA